MAVRVGKLRTRSTTLDWGFGKYEEIPSSELIKCSEFPLLPNHNVFFDVEQNCEMLRVFLNKLHNDPPLSFHYKVSLLDRNGKESLTKSSFATIAQNSSYINIVNWDANELNNVIGIEDNLILRCTLSMEGDSERQDGTSQTDSLLFTDTTSSKLFKTLSSDFERLYNEKADTDFVLKTSDGQFPVHRAVMSARSSYFAAMFRHDTSENAKGEADVSDVDSAILSNVLHYVYSGQICGLTADTAASIFTAADKYALLELREETLNYLVQNLTTGNICDAVRLTYVHSENTLENEVVSFIQDNMQEVLGTEEWKTFSDDKPLLVIKILSKVCFALKPYKDSSSSLKK